MSRGGTLRVRNETPEDIPAIHALTRDAFREAAHTSHTEQFIVDELRRAGALHLSLIAEDEGVIVGHVAISPITITDGTPDWYGLGPISVLPARQQQGIGSRLMREVLQRLKDQGAAGCVLVGYPAYYSRFGFRQAEGVAVPPIPAEFFLSMHFSGPAPRGIAAFHPAFEASGT